MKVVEDMKDIIHTDPPAFLGIIKHARSLQEKKALLKKMNQHRIRREYIEIAMIGFEGTLQKRLSAIMNGHSSDSFAWSLLLDLCRDSSEMSQVLSAMGEKLRSKKVIVQKALKKCRSGREVIEIVQAIGKPSLTGSLYSRAIWQCKDDLKGVAEVSKLMHSHNVPFSKQLCIMIIKQCQTTNEILQMLEVLGSGLTPLHSAVYCEAMSHCNDIESALKIFAFLEAKNLLDNSMFRTLAELSDTVNEGIGVIKMMVKAGFHDDFCCLWSKYPAAMISGGAVSSLMYSSTSSSFSPGVPLNSLSLYFAKIHACRSM